MFTRIKCYIFICCLFVNSYSLAFETQWSTYQANSAHSGFIALDINPNKYYQKWQYDLGEPVHNNPVTIGSNVIFVSYGKHIYQKYLAALNIETGKQLWYKRFDVLDLGQPTYYQGNIYFQTEDKWKFCSLVAKTGKEIYCSKLDGDLDVYHSPVVFKDVVYVATGEPGALSSIDIKTGDILWSIKPGFEGHGEIPAINENHLIYYKAPYLYDIDKKTGNILLKIENPFGYGDQIKHPVPVLDNDRAYIVSNGVLTAFDLKTQQISFVIYNVKGTASTDDQALYIVKDKHLVALDKVNGSLLWRQQDKAFNSNVSEIIVTNNTLFISENLYGTYAFDKQGQHRKLWSTKVYGLISLSKKGLVILSSNNVLNLFGS